MINESKNTLSPKMVSFMLVKHCNTSRFALPDLRNGTSGQSSGGGVVQRHPQDFDLMMMIISLVVLLLLFSFYILWYIYIYISIIIGDDEDEHEEEDDDDDDE